MESDPDYKKKKRDSHMRAVWGLSDEEYTNKWRQQKYCAICSVKLLGGLQTHLDHDHKSGVLRKFLCTNCNRGLGCFKDNSEVLMNAINYLTEHSKEGRSL